LFKDAIRVDASLIFFVLIIVGYIGGWLAYNKTTENIDQLTVVLSDIQNQEEPRSVNQKSAEAEYAIEHPLIRYKHKTAESKRAFDLYYESVRWLQAGNKMKARRFYQEATRALPALHEHAIKLLSSMLTQEIRKDQQGAICYWLGVHSEYLKKWRNAASWYEKAVEAYHQIGYKNRESRVHCNLGNVKMNMDDPSGMDEFEKAVTLNPNNGTAHINIARTYYMISEPGDSEYDIAIDSFANAIVADPELYGPIVISSVRGISYTWKDDLEEITKRVETKQQERFA
jgi:tetratricopeptide (TPR) repeat protein